MSLLLAVMLHNINISTVNIYYFYGRYYGCIINLVQSTIKLIRGKDHKLLKLDISYQAQLQSGNCNISFY